MSEDGNIYEFFTVVYWVLSTLLGVGNCVGAQTPQFVVPEAHLSSPEEEAHLSSLEKRQRHARSSPLCGLTGAFQEKADVSKKKGFAAQNNAWGQL